MIHVTVGTMYPKKLLVGRGASIDQALALVLPRLEGKRFISVDSKEKLKNVSVFHVLEMFHADLCNLLEEEGKPIVELLEFELRFTSEATYQQPTLRTTTKHAMDLLSLYGPLPHGTTSSGTSVFLPDLAMGVRLLGSLVTKMKVTPFATENTISSAILTTSSTTPDLECHLCDELFEVYRRAADFKASLAEIQGLTDSSIEFV